MKDSVGYIYLNRVSMAKGKQGIWLLTFPDRENTDNLVNLIFLHRENCANTGKIKNLEFFENFVIKVATR